MFEREFAEVPDAFDIDVVGALDDGLVVGAFPVDVVGRVEVHIFNPLEDAIIVVAVTAHQRQCLDTEEGRSTLVVPRLGR
ncbi:hypothetical protein [Halobacterium sp. KA-6]|uniref:hypothetical protein n=1 Tax=Halobacterium sp. KA-6 TaxID=2896368 RepID=UPI001E3DFB96|nr:hypothetical protein [Halobacterium sp. KA-6]MCD2204548.1 hypothetical protein [Halobacterium sp. KA-6]